MADKTKTPTPQRDDQGSQGAKGNQSYSAGVTRDENTGSSGSKGNQSYDTEGK